MASFELKGLKGLRDLESLISESKSDNFHEQKINFLAVELLQPGEYQPRSNFDEDSLTELSESIKAQGIIQPLIARKVKSGKYEIIAGERRWRAAKQANLKEVPVIIRNVDDNTTLAFALIENIQRQNLNPIEESVALAQLRDQFSMSHSKIAETVGRSRATVTNMLRLLTLDDSVKQFLKEGKLEMGHARALLSLDLDQQVVLAHKIIKKDLTVRDAENLSSELKMKEKTIRKEVPTTSKYDTTEWVNSLTEKLSSRVDIKLNMKGSGKIVIYVDSLEDVDKVVGVISEDS